MSALQRIEKYFNYRAVLLKDEVAVYLGYKPATLQKMIEHHDKDLRRLFYKAGKNWVCDIEDLAEFIDADKHKYVGEGILTSTGAPRYKRSPRY